MFVSASKKILVLSTLCLLALGLNACSKAKEMMGLERSAPDEFAVYSRAPLSLPPDFSLKPPTPGAERPQGDDETIKAQRALMGRAPAKADPLGDYTNLSPGLRSVLEKTGALDADPSIRQTVDRETSAFVAESESFMEDVIFWKEKQVYSDATVDAAKEAQRIRDAQALGQPIDGTKAITIDRKKKALLDGIFEF